MTLIYKALKPKHLMPALMFEQGYFSSSMCFYNVFLDYLINPEYCFACFDKLEIVGLIKALSDYKPGCILISVLCVNADYRRQGIAKKLLISMIDIIKQKKFNKIFLPRIYLQ